MDVPSRMIRVQDESVDIRETEMEHARLMVVDPNDSMIVMLAHDAGPVLAVVGIGRSIALDLHATFVIFVLVQEAGQLLLECACLQKLSDRTGIVEKLPLQLPGESVPLHDN